MEIFYQVLFTLSPVILLALGFAIGKHLERRHYESIAEREKRLFKIPVVANKVLEDGRPVRQARLAVGAVVVSADYYKRFLLIFRKIIGGEIRSYSPVIDRGRREAILRMKESCPDAHLFLNCQLATSSITDNRGTGIGFVEIVAYSTAITFES